MKESRTVRNTHTYKSVVAELRPLVITNMHLFAGCKAFVAEIKLSFHAIVYLVKTVNTHFFSLLSLLYNIQS